MYLFVNKVVHNPSLNKGLKIFFFQRLFKITSIFSLKYILNKLFFFFTTYKLALVFYYINSINRKFKLFQNTTRVSFNFKNPVISKISIIKNKVISSPFFWFYLFKVFLKMCAIYSCPYSNYKNLIFINKIAIIICFFFLTK